MCDHGHSYGRRWQCATMCLRGAVSSAFRAQSSCMCAMRLQGMHVLQLATLAVIAQSLWKSSIAMGPDHTSLLDGSLSAAED